MCVGKTDSEITKTCTSTCKNFSRCTARREMLASLYTTDEPSKLFDIKAPASETRARSYPNLVHSI